MFLPESIDLGHSEKYVLSIRIRPHGFTFSISDPEDGRNYCLRETSFSEKDNLAVNIQRIIFELSFLTQEFKQTNVIIVSSDYDLVPAPYFMVKEKDQLYNLTHTQQEGHILSDLIEKQDIVTLYSINDEIFGFLSRNLWDPHFFHHSTLLINLFENRGAANPNKSKMHLNFHENSMDVICFAGNKLVHSLTYENEPAANQAYFILKLWEICGFDQLEDIVYITGKADDLLIIRLQEYIKNIEQVSSPSEIYLWSEDAQNAPLDLLALSL
ncbi:DUF3822 family protein [Prevotella sp. 10(H)]|uniref:DUF3822 family protein n=1 Tax=Prevotella sp. 10(H) TaxID=1158294 RepID=UPI0004A72A33|nr:DUF3822 family protein [Prevotella sp. 10(H)]